MGNYCVCLIDEGSCTEQDFSMLSARYSALRRFSISVGNDYVGLIDEEPCTE